MTRQCLTQTSCNHSCTFHLVHTLWALTRALYSTLWHLLTSHTSKPWEGLREDAKSAEMGLSSCIIWNHGRMAHSWNLGKFRWVLWHLQNFINILFQDLCREGKQLRAHPQDNQRWVQSIRLLLFTCMFIGLLYRGLRVSIFEEAGWSFFLDGILLFSLFFKIMGSGLPLVETSLSNMFPKMDYSDNKGWQHLTFSPGECFI